MQAALNLSVTRGMGAPEARICYERAESLCHSLNLPLLLYLTLMGQWHYSFMTDKLSATMEIAKRVYALAQELDQPACMMGAYSTLAITLYYLGDFEAARRHAILGVQLWRSKTVKSSLEEIHNPGTGCLCYKAMSEWHLGEIASSQASMAEAVSRARELNDTHTLANILFHATVLGQLERDPAKVESLASEVIELSTRHRFAQWLIAKLYRGWAHCVFGDHANGLLWIEDALRDYRASGSMLGLSTLLAVKAEALHLADRTVEALEAIREAESLAQRYGERMWYAELCRLRGLFLERLDADEAQIEASFCEAINTAKQQKSASLATRAEESYSEYRRQKGTA